jgi:hypothetical protein
LQAKNGLQSGKFGGQAGLQGEAADSLNLLYALQFNLGIFLPKLQKPLFSRSNILNSLTPTYV